MISAENEFWLHALFLPRMVTSVFDCYATNFPNYIMLLNANSYA